MADTTIKMDEAKVKELNLITEQNKIRQQIVNVDKDILTKSKEIETSASAVHDYYESSKDALASGIESFTTSIFGGQIGGLINILTVGRYKRKKANDKIEKDAAEAEQKKTKEQQALQDKSHKSMQRS